MRIISLFIIVLFLILLTAEFSTSQTLETDRPDQTESSSTIVKGQLQIESGAVLTFQSELDNNHRQVLLPTTLFRIGIAKLFELRLLSQYENNKNQFRGESVGGISDLEIGTKIQILQKADKKTEIAFLSHLIVPTGSKSISLNKFGTINKLCVSHEFDGIAFGYNIGYDYLDSTSGDLTYSVAFGFSVTDKVSLYIEPFGQFQNLENHTSSMDAGITYLVHDCLQLDFSFGTGLNHTMNYLAIGASALIR